MNWTLYLEATAPRDLTPDQLDDLVDALAPWHVGGIGSHPEDRRRWSTTVTVEGSTLPAAFDAITTMLTALEGPFGTQEIRKLELEAD